MFKKRGVLVEIHFNWHVVSCLYNIKGNTIDALNLVKDIIDNYNRHLVSVKDRSDLIVALRMLEKNDIRNTFRENKMFVPAKSRELLRDNYNLIIHDDRSKSRGIIAIHPDDVSSNSKDPKQPKIVIYIEEKRIFLYNLVQSFSEKKYKLKALNSSFKITDLPISDMNLTLPFSFNEIEDVMELAKSKAWRDSHKPFVSEIVSI